MRTPNSPSGPPWTILKLLKWTTEYFQSRNIESPRADAEILLAETLQLNRIELYVRYDQPLTEEELGRFKERIRRRVRREPVAYIVGRKEFWSLDFFITRDVLIPRPETECLVEAVLPLLSETESMRILEIGTGSGAVSVALASERPRHRYVASDLSPKAIGVARKNAEHHRLPDTVGFIAGDQFLFLKAGSEGFHVIVSNPPYIRTNQIPKLQPEICRFEPHLALDGGENGLVCLSRIIASALEHLKPSGHLVLEIGHDQRSGVEKIIRSTGGYDQVGFHKDYSGHDRVVKMRKQGGGIAGKA